MTGARDLRVGLVGGGRTRNGLGPFLARFLDRDGARVVAVVGRNEQRAAMVADDLGRELGHEVVAHGDVASALSVESMDVLVISSPIETHCTALQLASQAGLHVLCEKPLVSLEESGAVPALLDRFVASNRVLVENCQWPRVLPALERLYPEIAGQPPCEVAMGLGPTGAGRRMVEDSLSHFLSVLQALHPQEVVRAAGVEYSSRDSNASELTLRMGFLAGDREVAGSLHLQHCPSPPRPAWISVNGCRMDRRIQLPDYRQTFHAADRVTPVDDPLGLLVYGFLQLIREPDVERTRETIRTVGERAGLYAEILRRW